MRHQYPQDLEGPSGFTQIAHAIAWLAEMEGVAPPTIRIQMNEDDAPKLKVAYRIGRAGLVNVVEAEAWAEKMLAYRRSEPDRVAARKAEEDRRFLARAERERDRLEGFFEGLDAMQQGSAEGRALAEKQKYSGPITRG